MLDKIEAKYHCKSQKSRVVILQEGFSCYKGTPFSTMKIAVILVCAVWMACVAVEAGKGKARKFMCDICFDSR